MGFFCLFGGPIANRIGLKWTLVLGAVGYPVYSAGLYTNNRYVRFPSVCVLAADIDNAHRETSGSFLLVLSPAVYQLDYSGPQKEPSLWVILHRPSVEST